MADRDTKQTGDMKEDIVEFVALELASLAREYNSNYIQEELACRSEANLPNTVRTCVRAVKRKNARSCKSRD